MQTAVARSSARVPHAHWDAVHSLLPAPSLKLARLVLRQPETLSWGDLLPVLVVWWKWRDRGLSEQCHCTPDLCYLEGEEELSTKKELLQYK